MPERPLTFVAALPPGIVLLLGAFLLYWSWRQLRALRGKVSGGRAYLLTGLRVGVYLLLLLFLLNPTLRERRTRPFPRSLAVLVDASESMAIRDMPGGESRWRAALRLLSGGEGSLSRRLGERYEMRLYRVGEGLGPLSPGDLARVRPEEGASQLAAALRATLSPPAGGSPDGVLLLSDGIATDGGPILPARAGGKLPPVLAVGLGDPSRFRDIRLGELRAPRLAFRGNPVNIEVELEVRGYTGKNLPVVLALEGQVLATQAVDVDRQPFRKVLSFQFVPQEVGSFRLGVATPLQAGEHILHNNRREQILEVRRDKIRVLALSGAPSWNYRFLRMALKQDPVVDLVSLIFLRSPADDPGAPSHELSLIPFPLETIFLQELKNFDLVIFDNFTYRDYFSWLYLDQVKGYVERGGGFAMIGGARAFGPGGYAESPLAGVLPISLSARAPYRRGEPARAELTAAGEAHPITRLAQDAGENRRLWRELPPIEGLNEEAAAPQGEVLLTAGERGERPLMVVGRYGQGRTLALLTDQLWWWNFGVVGTRGSNRLHLQLVRQMVRWLVNEPGTGQVLVLEGEARKRWEDPFTIRLQALDNSYRPAPGAEVRLELVDPQGQRERLEARYDPAAREFRATFRPRGEALHRVEAEAHLGGKLLGRHGRALAVAGDSPEREAGLPRWEFLQEAARATGGVFFSAERADEKAVEAIARAVEARLPTQVIEERQVRLWSVPFGSLAILLLLTSEWTLRRLWGLA